ncbi:MAG: universal stress protein [Desulfuromonadales bacterium]|nr:universal stress protein [Desulfuromonadales bacterium]
MSAQYRTILYATDLSVNAAQAFSHAIALAKSYDADLHVLHVMPEMDASVVSYVAMVIGEDRFANLELEHEDELKSSIRDKVDAFVRENIDDIESSLKHVKSIEVHHGSPLVEILKAADAHDADLIVVGSHGKGKLQYAFLGSVAEKLPRKSHRPVLIVPIGE